MDLKTIGEPITTTSVINKLTRLFWTKKLISEMSRTRLSMPSNWRASIFTKTIQIGDGSPMVFKSIEAFHAIAHLNPFTYLASGDVVTRLIIQDISNTNVTFGNGIIMLCIFSFAMIILNVIFAHRRDKTSMYAVK